MPESASETKATNTAPPGSRRDFLRLLAGSSLACTVPIARAQVIPTRAHIVIVGAGAAGIAAASRLSRVLDGARITIIDRRREHYYQPGYSLVAAGVWPRDKVIAANSTYMPDGVEWVQSMVAEYDPDANAVITDEGRRISYDFLVVATGLQLDYERIDGMSPDLIGRDGIGSVYASPDAAARTWASLRRFIDEGGTGLFGRPAGDIKCAGAPLKMTFMADDRLRRARRRGSAHLVYNADSQNLFGVATVNAKVVGLYAERGIEVNYQHVLSAIDPARREATFRTPQGSLTMDYDFIHVVPPMSAPESLANSELAWREGPFATGGWLEVDRETLRHNRYSNVFGAGDVNGVPRGKTAASVKMQVPVAVMNLLAALQDRDYSAVYNGYTSCPLITRIGQAMLVEFDYEGNLTPSFPFIDPLDEHWVAWVMKDRLLRPAYYAMLRGYI